MKYLSLFSGIGGFELGIQQAYEDLSTSSRKKQGRIKENSPNTQQQLLATEQPTCVGYSEIDKYACQIYEKHFNHKNYADITKINVGDLPDFDLLVGGFPCQAFSIAGKRRGFDEARGTLFFEILRICAEKRPRFVVLENVKGLLSHDGGKTFQTILKLLSDVGFRVEWQVLNSKNFGVPQNRERVFIIGHTRGESRRQIFPIGESNKSHLKEITSGVSDAQRIYTTDCAKTLKGEGGGQGAKTGLYAIPQTKDGNAHCLDANYHKGSNDPKKHTRTSIAVLTPDRLKKRQNGRRFKENGDPSFTLTAQDRHGIFDGAKIRRLTPTECERLQGFPDGWTEGVSNTQRYKTLGNAVTVNVIRVIMEKLI